MMVGLRRLLINRYHERQVQRAIDKDVEELCELVDELVAKNDELTALLTEVHEYSESQRGVVNAARKLVRILNEVTEDGDPVCKVLVSHHSDVEDVNERLHTLGALIANHKLVPEPAPPPIQVEFKK